MISVAVGVALQRKGKPIRKRRTRSNEKHNRWFQGPAAAKDETPVSMSCLFCSMDTDEKRIQGIHHIHKSPRRIYENEYFTNTTIKTLMMMTMTTMLRTIFLVVVLVASGGRAFSPPLPSTSTWRRTTTSDGISTRLCSSFSLHDTDSSSRPIPSNSKNLVLQHFQQDISERLHHSSLSWIRSRTPHPPQRPPPASLLRWMMMRRKHQQQDATTTVLWRRRLQDTVAVVSDWCWYWWHVLIVDGLKHHHSNHHAQSKEDDQDKDHRYLLDRS